MVEVLKELLLGSGDYTLALFGLSLPLVGGIIKGVGSAIGFGKEQKRADEGLDIQKLLADLQRQRFERGTPYNEKALELMGQGSPMRENLTSLYAANPFIGGKKALGETAVGAGQALGFDNMPAPAQLSGGPISQPPPVEPGPSGGESSIRGSGSAIRRAAQSAVRSAPRTQLDVYKGKLSKKYGRRVT